MKSGTRPELHLPLEGIIVIYRNYEFILIAALLENQAHQAPAADHKPHKTA